MSQIDPLHLDEKRQLHAAFRRLRDDASILNEARHNLSGALDKLGLYGNARQVFTPLLMAALTVVTTSSYHVIPSTFWGS